MYLWSFLLGLASGMRSMMPLAVVSWAARMGWLHLEGSWLAFLGYSATPYVLTVLALGELIADKLPKTPSRKAPLGFSGRIITGALCGAALGISAQGMIGGIVVGIVGAIAGTFGGYEFRSRLVRATGGKDLPIALLEDAITIVISVLAVMEFRA